jgi:hypothetical protein
MDEISASPNIIGLAEGDGVRAIVEAVYRRGDDVARSSRTVFIVLKPVEEFQLKLVTFDKFKKMNDEQKVVIRLAWRTTRFKLPFKRYVRIRTSVADIRAMKDGKTNVED